MASQALSGGDGSAGSRRGAGLARAQVATYHRRDEVGRLHYATLHRTHPDPAGPGPGPGPVEPNQETAPC